MSQEKLLRQGMLLQLEEEKKALSARAKAGLYVLRGIFTDVELQLDTSRFMEIDLEMIKAVVQDLQSLQEKYREVVSHIKEIKE